MTKLVFRQLVSVSRLQQLLEAQSQLTKVACAILDVEEKVLVSAGWQDICTHFHRRHPETVARCHLSDAHIKARLDNCPEGYVDYRCQNGLWDVAMPIHIHNQHLATLFAGQFFYDDDPPDHEFFRAQAARFGFDETAYLAALKQVPIVSRAYIRHVMEYCRSLVQMIAETGLQNLRLAQEIKERKKSEKEASFFRYLVENTRDPIYVLDPADGYRMVYVNAAACAHFGWDRETLQKMRIPDWDPSFDMTKLPELHRQMEKGTQARFETVHRVASGAHIPVEVTSSYLKYEGRPLTAGNFHDISERKAMVAALKERERNLIEAQRIAKVGNWTWDLSGRLQSASAECWRILGTSSETFAGTEAALLELICAEHREGVRSAFADLLSNRRPCSVEYHLRHPDGKEVTVHEQRELVCDTADRPIGTVGTLQDMTEQMQLLEALREKDLLLMQQSRMAAMGEMISYIAHQWRQPLHLIGLLVQCLEPASQGGPDQNSHRAQTVEQVMELVQHMSATIDDFRDFFRTDKEMEPFDLKEAVRKIVNFVSADLKMHDIALVFDAEDGLIVTGYANELSHVLLNILNNAKEELVNKAIAAPRIHIRLFTAGETKVITVRDNAGGIPEHILQRLFEAYFTTKEKGTGIGLYISKIIIEKHLQGSLTASNIDGGVEFRIEL
jgi:PAS domain S-box-containing protein